MSKNRITAEEVIYFLKKSAILNKNRQVYEQLRKDSGFAKEKGKKSTTPYDHIQSGELVIDGKKYHFRSKWERNYARYLTWKKRRGEIKDWNYECKEWEFPIKRGNRFYKCDFEVQRNDGTIYYDEVKGYYDSASKTKMKRMAKYHPEVEINMIMEKDYKALAAVAGKIIKDWEK